MWFSSTGGLGSASDAPLCIFELVIVHLDVPELVLVDVARLSELRNLLGHFVEGLVVFEQGGLVLFLFMRRAASGWGGRGKSEGPLPNRLRRSPPCLTHLPIVLVLGQLLNLDVGFLELLCTLCKLPLHFILELLGMLLEFIQAVLGNPEHVLEVLSLCAPVGGLLRGLIEGSARVVRSCFGGAKRGSI